MKIVEQGLYIHGKGRKQGYFFKILASSCWRSRSFKRMALRMNNEVLCFVIQTKHCIINQSNRVPSHVLVV